MNTQNHLHDTTGNEIYLLENVSIQGRKTELRQLLKLLNLSKNGQPKAVLVSGDPGIGKSALLDTFEDVVRKGVYSRVLNLSDKRYHSAEALYVVFIQAFQAEAESILNDALVAVNQITGELGLHWERQDLIRAVALVRLQESIGGRQAASHEQLVKAIRSSVPTVKKLKFSVNDNIEKLVGLIVNPWVMLATALVNPMHPEIQEAVRLANHLKDDTTPQTEVEAPTEVTLPSLQRATRNTVTETGENEELQPVEASGAIVSITPDGQPIAHAPADIDLLDDLAPPTEPPAEAPPSIHANGNGFNAPVLQRQSKAQTPPPVAGNLAALIAQPAQTPVDELVRHLVNVFDFVSNTLNNIDSSLLVLMDEWDRILDAPENDRNNIKELLAGLLRQTTEQKNYHFMLVLAARTAGESYTLGGPLYNLFRTKLLLPGLAGSAAHKLLRKPLKQVGVDLDEPVYEEIFAKTHGNAFWHLKFAHYLQERAETNHIRFISRDFYHKLGIENVHDLLELSFTRVKLAFLKDEADLFKSIAALLKQFGDHPFAASDAIREIATSQGFTDNYVFEVLRALYRHDFIVEDNARDNKQRPSDDPIYRIQSRPAYEFLREKTKTIQTDISTDEKLMYLKKIIPLSLQSGELDREKTIEVIALSNAIGNQDMIGFLENLFLSSLKDERPVVRVTALNNIAVIDSQTARDSIFAAMKDENAMVREYAARNLSLLTQKNTDPQTVRRIIDVLIECIDDDSESVREQVYETISKYRWHHDLVSVFIKGMSDASDTVRLISIRNLAELEGDSVHSPYVRNAFLDAMTDKIPEIRKYACLGIQEYPGAETIELLVKVLREDTDSANRALAADSLSRMENEHALDVLVEALNNEASEDVKLVVVRALGKRQNWKAEEILLNAIQSPDETSHALLWTCVRSLGTAGSTNRSLQALQELQQRISNNIVTSAIEISARKIRERIENLRLLERQLEDATPPVVAVPSGYEEEVVIVEDDLVES